MKGKVKWYNTKKGYGFIEGKDGQDYFVHYTALGNLQNLPDEASVTFEAAETEKGRQAKNVKLTQGESEEEAPASKEEASSKEPNEEKEDLNAEEKTADNIEDSEDFGPEEDQRK